MWFYRGFYSIYRNYINEPITQVLCINNPNFFIVSVAEASSPDRYLVSPSGNYHVGFLDYHWININSCPNKFESVVSQNSFSKNNPQHCNEIWVRVYYPTNEIGVSNYVPRLSLIPIIKQYYKAVSKDEIEQISHFQSFSKEGAKIATGKYPIIFFASGYGVLPQLYENILTTLVSYGYIVVAINSEFLNGSFKLSNGTAVDNFLPQTKEQSKYLFINSLEDLTFVYKQVLNKKLQLSITNSIDFAHVGLLGHSLGAATVAHFAEQQKVQSVVTLDLAWDNIYKNAVNRDFNAPFLEIFPSEIYLKNQSGNFPYLLKAKPLRKGKYLYIIRNKLEPNQKEYAIHMSFSDQATLASFPAINKAAHIANKKPKERFSGVGNGWNIAISVNEQLLLFFNQYLKVSSLPY